MNADRTLFYFSRGVALSSEPETPDIQPAGVAPAAVAAATVTAAAASGAAPTRAGTVPVAQL